MIEPTDEMVQAFRRVWRDQYQFGIASQEGATRDGLAAVLAIVERDLRPPPPRVLAEINQARAALPQPGDARLRAALWSCSTFSEADVAEAVRAAGFVHVSEVSAAPAPARCADCGRTGRNLTAVPDGDSTVLLGPTCKRRRLEAGRVRQALPIGAPKGWLIEHVDHHGESPVEGCTFCKALPIGGER